MRYMNCYCTDRCMTPVVANEIHSDKWQLFGLSGGEGMGVGYYEKLLIADIFDEVIALNTMNDKNGSYVAFRKENKWGIIKIIDNNTLECEIQIVQPLFNHETYDELIKSIGINPSNFSIEKSSDCKTISSNLTTDKESNRSQIKNIFKEGSAHDQMCAIFEFVERYNSFCQFPKSCQESHGKSESTMLLDLIDAYFGECMAVQRMIVQALSLLYIFDRINKTILLDFVKRVKSDKKFSTYEKLSAGKLFSDGNLPNSLSESYLISRFEGIIEAL